MQTQNILHDDECQYNNFKYICYAKGHFTQEYVNKNEVCFVGTKCCSKIKYVSKNDCRAVNVVICKLCKTLFAYPYKIFVAFQNILTFL